MSESTILSRKLTFIIIICITVSGLLTISGAAYAGLYTVITDSSHPASGSMIVADNGIPFYSIVAHNGGILEVHDSAESVWLTDFLKIGGSAIKAHFLVYSAFSLNVPNGVNVATLNVYYENGDSKSLDLIEGVNIAEWAYDRPENQAYLMHNKISPIYSWITHGDSEFEYKGHLFYVSIDLELKPLDHVGLVLNYRPTNGTWFAARVAGMTLERDVSIDIKPETLNLKSKGEFTAFINLPEGYNEEDIDINTVECEGAPALKGMMANDGKFIIKFDRKDLKNVPTGDSVELTVTGKLTDGTIFTGSDIIRVIDKK